MIERVNGTADIGWWLWTVAAGLAFAVTALIAAPLAGFDITSTFGRSEGQVTWVTLFAGVFLSGCAFWWLLVTRAQRVSPLRGAIAGVFVALFSYPVVLVLAELLQRDWGATGSLEDRGSFVLLRVVLTMLTTGFGATLVLALAGAVTGWLLCQRHPAAMAPPLAGLARRTVRAAGVIALGIVAMLGLVFGTFMLMPLDLDGLEEVASAPAADYAEAIVRFEEVVEREAGMDLNERCRSTLLTHGRKVARVVVYFHGMTSCPAQADVLSQQLFVRGYNVYLPRTPGHGEADPLTLALADMTAEELIGVTGEATDIAQGLGDEVVVVGLSAGGTMAAWVAQHRSDAERAIGIAPFLGPHVVPAWANHAAINALLTLPNAMVWWDPAERGNPPEMDYAYPRYSTRGLAQVMRLGEAVMAAAAAAAPLARDLGMLSNEADLAVNNALTEQVIVAWADRGRTVDARLVPEQLRLPHDMIDPRQPDQNIDFVYPLLFEMIEGRPAP